MSASAQLTAASAKAFMLAGNATVTFRSTTTGNRYTYKVRACDDNPDLFFVSLLSGPENTGDYTYLGIIRSGEFWLTAKSRLREESLPVKAFRWTWERIWATVEPNAVELWHEGRCGRCGRVLTVPESIEAGIGPECASKMGVAA